MDDNVFCRCLTGPIVGIIVGRRRNNDKKDGNDEIDDKSSNYSDVADKRTIEQQTFYVHKELLIAKSSFFAKTLSGDDTNSSSSTASSNSAWLKDEIGVVNLPEDDPEIVVKYLSLLYNGDSLAQQCSTLIVSKSDISEETTKAKTVELFARLCKLYVFCEKVQDINIKHNLLEAFVRVTTTPRQDGSLYALGSEFINILYAGTVKHDPVRKYLQDCAVRNKQDVWIEDVAKYNTEYLMDVEAAMYRYRPFSSTDWYRKVLEISRHLEKRFGSDDNGEATKSS